MGRPLGLRSRYVITFRMPSTRSRQRNSAAVGSRRPRQWFSGRWCATWQPRHKAPPGCPDRTGRRRALAGSGGGPPGGQGAGSARSATSPGPWRPCEHAPTGRCRENGVCARHSSRRPAISPPARRRFRLPGAGRNGQDRSRSRVIARPQPAVAFRRLRQFASCRRGPSRLALHAMATRIKSDGAGVDACPQDRLGETSARLRRHP